MNDDEATWDANVARLAAAHPALFSQMPEWSALPDGWFTLVETLCADIERELGPELARQVRVLQIKEKYAGLRFYARIGGVGKLYLDAVGAGGSRMHMAVEFPVRASDAAFESEESLEFSRGRARMYELIDAACNKSLETCDVCGQAGHTRRFGWLRTLCDAHFAEVQQRIRFAGADKP